MKSYHNTVPETGKSLAENTAKAIIQDDMVFKVIKLNDTYHEKYCTTPEWIWEHDFDLFNIPLTSIRRSFSNLQKRGLIEKTGQKVMGMYGRKINLWRLVK